MRVATWNMNKRKDRTWDWLIGEIKPDIALVQEASPLPSTVPATVREIKRNHRTAIYSRDNAHTLLKMHDDENMGLIAVAYRGICFINVYGNMDFRPLFSPLLGYLATYVAIARHYYNFERVLVAGDFNMDPRMDDNPTKTRFSKAGTQPTKAFFQTLIDLGLRNCQRKFSNDPVQTIFHTRSRYPWELDHMFATEHLFSRLESIDTLGPEGRSDHCPIVANFTE